jgi:hypothetical protein
VQEFKKPQHAGALWIMKPIARSQGKGIFLFNKLAQITQWKSEYRWKPENAAVSDAIRCGRLHYRGGVTAASLALLRTSRTV